MIFFATSLSGCFYSQSPFFSEKDGVIPFDRKMGITTIRYDGKDYIDGDVYSATPVSNYYIMQSEKELVRVIAVPMPEYPDIYILQMEGLSSKEVSYILAKIRNGGWFSSEKFINLSFNTTGLEFNKNYSPIYKKPFEVIGKKSPINIFDKQNLIDIYKIALDSSDYKEIEYGFHDLSDDNGVKKFSEFTKSSKLVSFDRDRDLKSISEKFQNVGEEEFNIKDIGGNFPKDFLLQLENIINGKAYNFDDKNIPFMAGLGLDLLERCGLPKDISERAEVTAFGTKVALGAAFATSDIGLGKIFEIRALMETGIVFSKTLNCSSPTTSKISNAVVKAIKEK